ncbi:MAG: DNA polymerase III subunit delta [Oscillospiraceae bacterium]|jgi:DNA polymerase-3 subunit delta|nr:DNA polymerase III subunit delta [Oscillospiraceae bacterium]
MAAAKKQEKNTKYEELVAAIEKGALGQCYILHGEERYLLERRVEDIRRAILPGGIGGFDYRRYSGVPEPDELRDAVNTYPLLSERALVEVTDFDFSCGLDALLPELRKLPEHVCLLFICPPGGFGLDGRTTAAKELAGLASIVEFEARDVSELAPWAQKRFADAGVVISPSDAEYLTFLAGGYMAPLAAETDKLISHCPEGRVSRRDIDALADPVPDAVTYKLTDALAARDYETAGGILSELYAMREPPHKISYALTSKMRALLLARLYLGEGRGIKELMAVAGVRYEFQAKGLLAAARGTTSGNCLEAVRLCCEAAFRLNDGGGQESLTELLVRLAERNLP